MKRIRRKCMSLTVVQQPVRVSWECNECYCTNDMDYEDFTIDYGECCDWDGQELRCVECGARYIIDEIEWD